MAGGAPHQIGQTLSKDHWHTPLNRCSPDTHQPRGAKTCLGSNTTKPAGRQGQNVHVVQGHLFMACKVCVCAQTVTQTLPCHQHRWLALGRLQAAAAGEHYLSGWADALLAGRPGLRRLFRGSWLAWLRRGCPRAASSEAGLGSRVLGLHLKTPSPQAPRKFSAVLKGITSVRSGRVRLQAQVLRPGQAMLTKSLPVRAVPLISGWAAPVFDLYPATQVAVLRLARVRVERHAPLFPGSPRGGPQL